MVRMGGRGWVVRNRSLHHSYINCLPSLHKRSGIMSFFGDLHSGIRQPEVVMNAGPLPPENTGGYGAGMDGIPDGRINYNSTLLGLSLIHI